jgi:hypothetical protein
VLVVEEQIEEPLEDQRTDSEGRQKDSQQGPVASPLVAVAWEREQEDLGREVEETESCCGKLGSR